MKSLPEGLQEWVDRCAPALGLDPADVPIAELLGMTGVVAHGVVRPAAPVTAYLLGLAVGRGMVPSDEEGDAAIRALVASLEAEPLLAGEARPDGESRDA